MEITVENCGSSGWIAIFTVRGRELLRSGKHYKTPELAMKSMKNTVKGMIELIQERYEE